MTEKTDQDNFGRILENRKIIVLVISVFGIIISDLTIASSLPFWLPPIIMGIAGGIILGSSYAGLFSGLGTLVGRLISILLMILTIPGLMKTLDLFLAAIGDVLGAPLPPGSLIVFLLSGIICGLFGLLGGLIGGSGVKITLRILESREVGT